MAKIRVIKKPTSVLKVIGSRVRKTPARSRTNTGVVAPGNADYPLPSHLFQGLSPEQLIALDLHDYGFNHIKIPTAPPTIKLSRRKLPNTPTFARKMMGLMQNKLSHLRTHFAVEPQDLICRGVDKKRVTPSEQAMLAEAADPKKLLSVSRAAQDCLRLILYYDAMFMVEDAEVGRERVSGDGALRGERAVNVRNREAIWKVLRLEIAEQLPGGKRKREQRADVVLHEALDLVEKSGEAGNGGNDKEGKAVRSLDDTTEDVGEAGIVLPDGNAS